MIDHPDYGLDATPTQGSLVATNPAPLTAEQPARERTCKWLPRCTNPAGGVVNHGPLGDLPTCDECADRYDLDLRVGP